LTDPELIKLVRNCGFFTMTDLEAEEAARKAEIESASAKAAETKPESVNKGGRPRRKAKP